MKITFRLQILNKKFVLFWVVVAHTFNPSTWEGGRGRWISVSSRPAWATRRVPGQSELCGEIISRKTRQKQINKQKKIDLHKGEGGLLIGGRAQQTKTEKRKPCQETIQVSSPRSISWLLVYPLMMVLAISMVNCLQAILFLFIIKPIVTFLLADHNGHSETWLASQCCAKKQVNAWL